METSEPPTTLYNKIMRIIQGPKIESSSIFGKIKALGQTFLRTPAFEEVQQSWINGEGAAAAVGLTLMDNDKAAIQAHIQIVGITYAGYEPTEILKYKADAAGAYIIKKLLDNNLSTKMSYEQYVELIKKARGKKEIVDVLKESYNPSMMGGRRSRKSKKTRKARKARKARNAINKRRSQRNRK